MKLGKLVSKKSPAKVTSFALAAVLALTPITAFGATDTSGHWAQGTIDKWEQAGLIKGYEDGSFKPDNSVTRAEFVKLLNQTMGVSENAALSFSDVAAADWFYNDVAMAVKAGYASGFEDGTFQPNATVTRAQAASFIAKATGKTGGTANGFTDSSAIPAWASAAVGAVVDAGYMSGYPDGSFGPLGNLTRAEAVTILDRVLGEKSGEQTSDDLVITKSETVKDQDVAGNVTIGTEVGNGEVTLDNVTIKGNLVINGGGKNSVYVKDSKVGGTVVVNKSNVHVQMQGTTSVPNMTVNAACNIDAKDFTGTVGMLTTGENLGASDKVTIGVEASTVNVTQPANIAIAANVGNVEIAKTAEGTKVDVAKGATVATVTADAKASLTGSGTVSSLNANASGITLGSGMTVTDTKTADGVKTPTKQTVSSGGGGGGGTTITDVSGVTPAILEDHATNPITELYDADSYNVKATKSSANNYVDVVVSASNLKNHTNGDVPPVQGYWCGFALVAPDGASKVKYAFNTTSDLTTLSNATALEPNVAGAGKNGIAFYTNAGAETPKTWCKVQWCDAAGNDVGTATTYKMNLSGVTCDAEAQIGNAKYETLEDAVTAANAATSDVTVKLLKAITLSESIEFTGQNITIDLNGKVITATTDDVIHNNGGAITLKDSGTNGKIVADSEEGLIWNETGTLNIESGIYESSDYTIYIGATEGTNNGVVNITGGTLTSTAGNTIDCLHNNTLNISGGTLKATGVDGYVISGNNAKSAEGNVINISGSAYLESTQSTAVYHSPRGQLNISGGTIKGTSAVETKAGTTVISGGTMIATANLPSKPGNNNGTSTGGYAVALVENGGYITESTVSVSITGGTFTGAVAKETDSAKANTTYVLSITGGIFNTDVSTYTAENYICQSSNDGYTVASIDDNIINSLISAATAYNYSDNYVYTGISSVAGTEVTSTYSTVGNEAMYDMARYFGALYRVENGVTKLFYGNNTYVWDEVKAGNLSGSNWVKVVSGEETSTTLVHDITAAYVADNNCLNNGIVIGINGLTNSITFKVAIETV